MWKYIPYLGRMLQTVGRRNRGEKGNGRKGEKDREAKGREETVSKGVGRKEEDQEERGTFEEWE